MLRKNPSCSLVRARPPRAGDCSSNLTLLPCLAIKAAAASPAIPPPMMIVSVLSLLVSILFPPSADNFLFSTTSRLRMQKGYMSKNNFQKDVNRKTQGTNDKLAVANQNRAHIKEPRSRTLSQNQSANKTSAAAVSPNINVTPLIDV